MYLQSLELFGFKSFAPKTKLEFHRGVTAVVGPNGCGKSNVLDAMRWVLGEQSAKALRGGEMADVIFSGTDSRAAVGMAEVSMTFAECEEQLGLDWHEVTLTRRVFRDGGSEYFLNKTPCRLKDIHQLFMDTGIGRSAYSIMEQGKIDMILSSRPEDRRAIFEEAAGITKYKSQKKEALRKLEATEANLLRLSDIIKEVKRQIGSLQRQAGKARRYQSLISDLKLLETHSAKRQFDLLAEQQESIRVDLARLVDKQTESQQEIESRESEAAVHRAALDEIEQRLNSARQGVADLKTRISNHENRIIFNEERALEFEQLVDRYRGDVAGAEEKFRIAETQLHDTDVELEQITTMLASELRVMEEKQAATAALTSQRQEAERAINTAMNDMARVESRVSGLRGQVSSVSQQRDGAEARMQILTGELDQLTFAFAEFTDRLRNTQAEIDHTASESELRSAQLADAEVQLREIQASLAETDRVLRETQRSLAERDSKVEVLRNLIEGGEGLSEGTQAVLRGLDNPDFFKPAVAGALAQLIEVEPQHVRAVETALNGHLQAVVMKDVMVAEAVIKSLTSQRLGRATLALRELMPLVSGGATESIPGLQPVRSLVRSGDDLAPLLDALLSNTYLVDSLERALELRRNHAATFVTAGGELLTLEGLLIGGAAGGATNSLLERKNQMHTLEAEAEQIRLQVEEATQKRQDLVVQIESAQARLDEVREEKQNLTVHLSTLRSQFALVEREAKETERKQQNLEGERASSEARHREAVDRVDALESEVASNMQQLEALQARRAEGSNELEVLRSREGELAAELNDLRVKVATERQRHSSLHHQRAPMEARIVELTELIAQRQQDIVGYQQRAESTVAENAEIAVNLERLREQVGEGETAVMAMIEERSGLAAATEEMSNALRVLRHQLSEAHDQRSRLEVRQTQVDMKLTAITEHIQKRYQIDLATFERDLHGLRVAIRDHAKRQQRAMAAEAAEEAPSGAPAEPTEAPAAQAEEAPEPESEGPMVEDAFAIDWDRIDAIVREIDSRIDSMGPVNLDAIQEYDELEQRHTFLEQQNTDLTNSKAELMETITKINATTKTLFAETFEKIRVNFGEMFLELFGGGKANLVLTDESDPLESGIDIIAKPPGKQLTSISLLSGGEKTMTAVALLFSIYMVKPSPFCVLDEMDAPLDESNINRFIKILDRFVGQSQFVVISHNKRTIARADALYGVTMEEHGVSKLVGVKFSRRDESQQNNDVLGSNNPAPVPSVAEAFGKSPNLHSENLESANGAA
ncbi:chromosome segregation protein SMC [Chthoniobacter flavus Ellin428]|uniref:Chromosome partition protein Smc n=1 Tax=Chthoniobacter flavus Ellin428 TaxID=497964 RepID=B4D705_9BACT|nr:chromosome segregation protein SMC [Chthoniobacter flavus]EDY17656.1 chromosome segregation protein SMC [Chthoniobacter flavus Ellin428]TCO84075.1 condensin subunit Smc [Chthoniobacter flavus]